MDQLPLTREAIEIVIGLHVFFQDKLKVVAWLKTENPNFGGCRPVSLIRIGRGHKVLAFINIALEENRHP